MASDAAVAADSAVACAHARPSIMRRLYLRACQPAVLAAKLQCPAEVGSKVFVAFAIYLGLVTIVLLLLEQHEPYTFFTNV